MTTGKENATHLQIGLPLETIAQGIETARQAGEARVYLTLPAALVWTALHHTGGTEMRGHTAPVDEAATSPDPDAVPEPVIIELDDDDFDVSGHRYMRA